MSLRTILQAGLLVLATTGGFGQPPLPPVISLKDFTSVSQWVLEITWHAKETFEDGDYRAGLEMTATARFYLKRLDSQDAWARWESQKEQSSSLVYTGFLLDKRKGQRLDYKGTSASPLMAVANFQVGGSTPGYQLVCQAMFPAEVTGAGMGTMNSALTVMTTELGAVPRFCTGPLPASGTTISGSTVIPTDIPPFGTSRAPRTRVGIQYLLKPVIELAPLKPLGK